MWIKIAHLKSHSPLHECLWSSRENARSNDFDWLSNCVMFFLPLLVIAKRAIPTELPASKHQSATKLDKSQQTVLVPSSRES